MTDLIQLQSELVRDVSSALRSNLTGAEQQRVTKRYTENTEAYQLYLRGRYHWNKRKKDDFLKSIEYFGQAIDKDPTYALAYAGLADTYIVMPAYFFGSPQEYYPKARSAAEKAIEIDPGLAEAHNALASVLSNYDWRFSEAEAEWEKTLELNPNYATGHQWYAEHLLATGRFEEALAEMRRAQELDPLSLIINGLVGVLLRVNGQNDAALEQLKKTLDMDPNFPRTHLFLAEAYQAMGRYDEAVDEFSKTFILNGASADDAAKFSARVKSAYQEGGATAYARAMAEVLESHAAVAPAPPIVIASYWVKAGETDRAFALLDKAFNQHSEGMLMIKDGRLRSVESDPRFRDLVRKMGLPE
jgi:tetratricopeptide (TPR) repeat protein